MPTARLDEGLSQTTVPNGPVVLSETLTGVRSVAVGIYVRSASAHERPEEMGLSHLLEHMVFKGTERRTARELALALEVRGGSLDAYTGRDYTSYQAHVLDIDLPLAVEVLTDLVRRPLLKESDLELERNVVLEEINGVYDTPDDLVFELHSATLWPGHPYGYAILGTPETLGRLGVAELRRMHTARYTPSQCVIAAAGNIDHSQLLAVLEREGWFAGAGGAEDVADPAVTAGGVSAGLTGINGHPPRVPPAQAARGQVRREARDSAQAHIVFGTDIFPLRDRRRFPLAILTNAFGGGMSSRLFQRVREELGLAYAVFAYKHFYRDLGQLGVYVGTQGAAAEQAVETIRGEYDRIAREGLSAAELTDGKQQLKGQVMLSLESPAARMARLAGFVLYDDVYRPLDQVLADIDAVRAEDIAGVAAEFFPFERQTIVQLGPGVPG